MAMVLDHIVPWGRSKAEYERMFALSESDWDRKILDCGGGPASLTAELAAEGHQSVAADPLYVFAGSQIRTRFECTADRVIAQVRATPNDWTWTFHRSPDDLLANRRSALERFLAHYQHPHSAGAYVGGELPNLPFRDNTFGVALCSHLLFLYSELLSADFHIASLRELGRVARELRVFPLLDLHGNASPHLPAVRYALDSDGWSSKVVQVDYELQRGGNRMLQITRR